MVLLSAEQELTATKIAALVRESEATVLRWLNRSLAEDVDGLYDAPHPGRPAAVTAPSRAALGAAVRRRPRSLGLPFSVWTVPCLVDSLAERPGLRGSDEPVRRTWQQAGLVLSRPQHTNSRPDPASQGTQRRWKRPATP
jgi:transposase